MSVPVWPASLPKAPLLQGFSRVPADNVVRTDNETGPPDSRPRSTASVEVVTATYRMTAAQFETFKTFWRSSLAQGALAFDLPDPEDEALTVRALFTEPYKPQRRRNPGLRWVACKFLFLP